MNADKLDLTAAYRPTTRPSFGVNSTAESGAFEDDYDEEGEDWELEEELAKLDEYFECE